MLQYFQGNSFMGDIDRPAKSSNDKTLSRPVSDIMELYAQGNILNPNAFEKCKFNWGGCN
jgi:hypothetical protein